jgi:hypothetical protein
VTLQHFSARSAAVMSQFLHDYGHHHHPTFAGPDREFVA